MNLFQASFNRQIEQESPLANRMRPRTLDEYVGQSHIMGQGRLLRRAIEADQLSSLVFYGPPGTGKTTLARVIANTTKSQFVTLNAVLAGVKQLREEIAAAIERRQLYQQRTTLFIDEVHRWNKAQQDALLPHVENGTIILIGTTTSNPYFEVNKALVSRSRIFQLRPLTEANLKQIVASALADEERGYGKLAVDLHEDARDHIVNVANGDARSVLNALELAVETTPPNDDGVIVISLEVAEESIQRRAVLYDKDGDVHYDTISAFIKSLRGSDPDAALYWAAKMIYAGEDPHFIFRRMGIFAGEDIGMADPQAAVVVNSCWSLYERIGLPEGQFPLTQAIIYLATAPKSNSAFAYFDALQGVEAERDTDVPNHLKDGNRDKEGFGHGIGYKYPHSYHEHWVAQQYLPAALQGKVFYQPGDQGYEGTLAHRVLQRREEQLAVLLSSEEDSAEILTMSPKQRGKEAWLQRTMSNAGKALGQIRDRIFALARLQRHHTILNLKADNGLLLWEAVRQAPEGGVWGLAYNQQAGETLRHQAERLPEVERPFILIGSTHELKHLLALRSEDNLRFDRMVAHNPLSRLFDDIAQVTIWKEYLQPDGIIVFAQTIPRLGQRIYRLVDWTGQNALREHVATVEDTLWHSPDNPLTNWSNDDLQKALEDAGWHISLTIEPIAEKRRMAKAMLKRWFQADNAYYQALAAAGLPDDELSKIQRLYEEQLENQVVNWSTQVAFVTLKAK
ncbi:MAG: AAA family ATPase [Chloroflexi bacterium]|nr:MAG: AAA family ATPase [Chloroflexota bacterium]